MSDRLDIQLVAFDMEGCLTVAPTVWEIMHRRLGTWDSHGAVYWQRYLRGEFHYDDFTRLDVRAWQGAPERLLAESAEQVPLIGGCRKALDALKSRGVRLVLISNGLTHLARRFRDGFGFDAVRANRAVVRQGVLTGELAIEVPYDEKGAVLEEVCRELGVAPGAVASVGDARADIAMFQQSRVSVAVRPREQAVADAATHVLQDHDLRCLAEMLIG